MQYYSTNNKSHKSNFREATLQGQPVDKGLYFPERIPILAQTFLREIKQLTKEEIALEVIRPYVGDTIDEAVLKMIVAETVDFPFPLVNLDGKISTLELFHGPTLAFKDVGARFMSRCLGYFSQNANRRTTVLVATSGDTGGAVANAFHNVENVSVVILYPSSKVSDIQERQLTTLGGNVTALQIDGTFDDCQRMVKEAFADKDLNEQMFLTSANSINVARWLPQQFYYFYAYQQWREDKPPVIAVPSGNFGNICAGMLAYRSGLPVSKFIAACNANDVASGYLSTGKLTAKPSTSTLSNAMDVGHPSNFIRILELFQHEHKSIQIQLSSFCISDDETVSAMNQVKQHHHYLLDPHGAVGYVSLRRYLDANPDEKGYFLETAHPVKFDVEKMINETVPLPEVVKELFTKQKISLRLKADANALKEFLLDSN